MSKALGSRDSHGSLRPPFERVAVSLRSTARSLRSSSFAWLTPAVLASSPEIGDFWLAHESKLS